MSLENAEAKAELMSPPAACYAFSVALYAFALLVLFVRGPHAKGSFGWGGNYSLRKRAPKVEEEGEETVVEPLELKDRV